MTTSEFRAEELSDAEDSSLLQLMKSIHERLERAREYARAKPREDPFGSSGPKLEETGRRPPGAPGRASRGSRGGHRAATAEADGSEREDVVGPPDTSWRSTHLSAIGSRIMEELEAAYPSGLTVPELAERLLDSGQVFSADSAEARIHYRLERELTPLLECRSGDPPRWTLPPSGEQLREQAGAGSKGEKTESAEQASPEAESRDRRQRKDLPPVSGWRSASLSAVGMWVMEVLEDAYPEGRTAHQIAKALLGRDDWQGIGSAKSAVNNRLYRELNEWLKKDRETPPIWSLRAETKQPVEAETRDRSGSSDTEKSDSSQVESHVEPGRWCAGCGARQQYEFIAGTGWVCRECAENRETGDSADPLTGAETSTVRQTVCPICEEPQEGPLGEWRGHRMCSECVIKLRGR